MFSANENPRRIFSDEGLVELSLNSYFLQHLPAQHFALPWQQSAGDVAVAVPMNATKVAIKRRYFIRSSFSVSLRNSATTLSRAEPAIYQEITVRGGGTAGRCVSIVACSSPMPTVPIG